MYKVSRKLFLFHSLLLAGCHSRSAKALTVSGRVDIAYIARLYSMKIGRSSLGICLKNKWNTLEIEERSRSAWVNGVKVWLHHPSDGAGNKCSVHAVDFKKGIDPILRAYAYLPKKVPRVVVLDPGHGGKDPGATGPGKVQEKTVVLDIALRTKKILESRGIKVYMTRSGDTYPTLEQRAAYAKKVKADLFISIHADGAGAASACGVETFVMAVEGGDSTNSYGKGGDSFAMPNNTFDVSNAALGYSLQSNLLKASKRNDRGLRRARFSVLKNAPCPAALVECGFLTNPTEEGLLKSAPYRAQVAQGVCNGIFGYITLVKHTKT